VTEATFRSLAIFFVGFLAGMVAMAVAIEIVPVIGLGGT
jgi:hypothetical protein